MAETNGLDRAVLTVFFKFKIPRLNSFQIMAIFEFVKRQSDVFISLLTSYGKLQQQQVCN